MAGGAPKKVVILGGGCGAMAAAFALTDRDPVAFDITVYQPGWRLDGKGASGRNSEQGERIQEHGLHVWSGFYENAFWMMRKCYRELDRPATHPLASAFSAFSRATSLRWDFGSEPTGISGKATCPTKSVCPATRSIHASTR